MAVAELVDGRVEVDVPQREVNLIKQVPGARYHARSQRWRAPLTWAACLQLRGVFGEKLHTGESLTSWAWTEWARVGMARELHGLALDPERRYPESDSRLYPFQSTAVEFLKASGGAILGDDLGTGKTVQSLVATEHWPLLVVTTKSVKAQWAAAVLEWTGAETFVLDGTVAKRRKTFEQFEARWTGESRHALIVNWHQLQSHSRLAPYGSIALSEKERTPKELNAVAWGTVIADEAHKAKEPKTKWTRALWALGDVARTRYALTGTPMEGSLLDFWALLRFVAPEEWPTRSGFVDRYCVSEYNFFGGLEVGRLRADTEDEFREIIQRRFLRRPKELVAPWLPKKTYVTRHAEMSAPAAKAYKGLADDFVAELDAGGEIVAFTDLTVTARLAQLTSAMLEEVDGGTDPETGDPVVEYRMVEPSPKLDVLEEILDELGSAPVAVFSASRQLLALAQLRLEKAGVEYGLIAGDIPAPAREVARDDYNAGRVRVLLISMTAGAEGLNLTRGSHEVFLDRHWSFLTNRQADDRMHGIGRGDQSAEALTIIDVVVPDTVDEGRYKLYHEKGELMEALVKDREAVKRVLRGESA